MSSLFGCKPHGHLVKLLTNWSSLNRGSTGALLNHLLHQQRSSQFYSTGSEKNDYINSPDYFIKRHIGPTEKEKKEMLKTINYGSIEELISDTVPNRIRLNRLLNLNEPLTETELISKLKATCSVNAHEWRSYIGLGYYNTLTPPVIQRNILENPGWYTQYTPYQAEIAQGRLESLLNYQTMICDLTGFSIANASLLGKPFCCF